MGLIADLQKEIIDSNVSTTFALRKALVLSYKLDNKSFREWVSNELDGYPTNIDSYEEWEKTIPYYRTIRPKTLYDGISGYYQITGGPLFPDKTYVPPHILTEHLTNGIGGLETLADTDRPSLHREWPNYLILRVNAELGDRFKQIHKIYNVIPVTFIREIIETVRNKLLRFTLELIELDPALDYEPNRASQLTKEVQSIYNITIMGGENVSVFNQSNQSIQGNQFNAAGDINFDNVQTDSQFAEMLVHLKPILETSLTDGSVDEAIKLDAHYQLDKAIQETKSNPPDKSKVLSHLKTLQTLVQGITQIAGFGVILEKAIEAIAKLHGS